MLIFSTLSSSMPRTSFLRTGVVEKQPITNPILTQNPTKVYTQVRFIGFDLSHKQPCLVVLRFVGATTFIFGHFFFLLRKNMDKLGWKIKVPMKVKLHQFSQFYRSTRTLQIFPGREALQSFIWSSSTKAKYAEKPENHRFSKEMKLTKWYHQKRRREQKYL